MHKQKNILKSRSCWGIIGPIKYFFTVPGLPSIVMFHAMDANLSFCAAGVSRWIHHYASCSVPSKSRRRSSSH